MPALAQQPPRLVNDHSTDSRIGFNMTQPACGERKCAAHHGGIIREDRRLTTERL
jgi:hypothetical protein